MTIPHHPDAPAATDSAARVREISAARPPEGLDIVQLAGWYAERAGALSWHALVLADEIDRRDGAR